MGGGRKPAHHRDEHTTLGRVHFPGESRLSETHLPAGQLQRTGGHERQFAKLHKHRCILARRKWESPRRQLCLRTGRHGRRLPICRSPRSGKRHTDDVDLRDNDSPQRRGARRRLLKRLLPRHARSVVRGTRRHQVLLRIRQNRETGHQRDRIQPEESRQRPDVSDAARQQRHERKILGGRYRRQG